MASEDVHGGSLFRDAHGVAMVRFDSGQIMRLRDAISRGFVKVSQS